MNNYDIQLQQAKAHFLTYDQQEIIDRCRLEADEDYFYFSFLGCPYRMERKTGNLAQKSGDAWLSGDSFGEVMTVLDWLCDSRPDRFPTGRWTNVVSQGHYFHSNLQEEGEDPDALLFDKQPEKLRKACLALGGTPHTSADISYRLTFLEDLQLLVQFWHGDEEFPPRLRFLWDENVLRYIRYETTWYAIGVLVRKLREKANEGV